MNFAVTSRGFVAKRARRLEMFASSCVVTFDRRLRSVISALYPRRKNGTSVESSWIIANPWSQRSTCSYVLIGHCDGGVVLVWSEVSVPPVPPLVAQPPSTAIPAIDATRAMENRISSLRALVDCLHNQRDALAA